MVKYYDLSVNINPKVFSDYSQTIDDVYENLEDFNPTKKITIGSVWWYDIRYGS